MMIFPLPEGSQLLTERVLINFKKQNSCPLNRGSFLTPFIEEFLIYRLMGRDFLVDGVIVEDPLASSYS